MLLNRLAPQAPPNKPVQPNRPVEPTPFRTTNR